MLGMKMFVFVKVLLSWWSHVFLPRVLAHYVSFSQDFTESVIKSGEIILTLKIIFLVQKKGIYIPTTQNKWICPHFITPFFFFHCLYNGYYMI